MLRPRAPAALRRFISTVTDPRSTRFGASLRRGQFAARVGPRLAARAGVIAALRAGGLRGRPGLLTTGW